MSPMVFASLRANFHPKDSEARIDLLRQRAGGSSSSKKRLARAKDLDDMKKIKDGTQGLVSHDAPEEAVTTLTASSGHINLFASLESTVSGQQLQLMDKKAKEAAAAKEAEKGAPLAPSANDLRPWYTDRDLVSGKERERDKDERAKDRRRYARYPNSNIIRLIRLCLQVERSRFQIRFRSAEKHERSSRSSIRNIGVRIILFTRPA